MKKTLFILAVLLGKIAHAQYFEHRYGAANLNETNSQMVPVTLDPAGGYLLVGQHVNDPSTAPYSTMHIVRTNNIGNVIPGANNKFTIADAQNNPLDAYATSVAPVNLALPGFNYAIAGTVTTRVAPLTQVVAFMRSDGFGNLLYAKQYSFLNYTLLNPRVIASNNSANNNTVYITGYCKRNDPGNFTYDVYIFSINFTNGAINWGKVYDVKNRFTQTSFEDFGFDLIENPYSPTPELLVVGSSQDMGLLLKVNATNGAPVLLNPVTVYTLTDIQKFYCIRRAANPAVLTNDGFIVGGTVNAGGLGTPNFDMWTLLINQNGNVTWSTSHNTSGGNPIHNFCFDIMERVNSLNNFEYYAVGDWKNTTLALSNIQALKLAANGMLVANGEFLYGSGLTTELFFARSIQPSNTGGITISGSKYFPGTLLNESDQLLINAYYSGHTTCDNQILSFTSSVNNPYIDHPLLDTAGTPVVDTLWVTRSPLSDVQVCYNASLPPPASNAKSAPADQPKNGFGFSIRENGSGQAIATGVIEVDVINNLSDKLEVQIIDMLGRKIECALDYDANDLKNGHIRIKVPALQHGNYYVVLTDGVNQKTQTLIVR